MFFVKLFKDDPWRKNLEMTVFPLGELQNFCDCLWQLRDDMSLFVPLAQSLLCVSD